MVWTGIIVHAVCRAGLVNDDLSPTLASPTGLSTIHPSAEPSMMSDDALSLLDPYG